MDGRLMTKWVASVTLRTVAPNAMPAPKTGIPACRPVVLATVTIELPKVVEPVVKLLEEFGLMTLITYSLVLPTVMPLSKPPRVVVQAVFVTAPVTVKSSAPLVTASDWPEPEPVTLRAGVAALFRTRALIVLPPSPVRSACPRRTPCHRAPVLAA